MVSIIALKIDTYEDHSRLVLLGGVNYDPLTYE